MNLVEFLILFFAMSLCFLRSLTNGIYSNLFIVTAFSFSCFSDKTSSRVKISCLQTFPDDKAEILTFCLSILYSVLLNFVISCSDFSPAVVL